MAVGAARPPRRINARRLALVAPLAARGRPGVGRYLLLEMRTMVCGSCSGDPALADALARGVCTVRPPLAPLCVRYRISYRGHV